MKTYLLLSALVLLVFQNCSFFNLAESQLVKFGASDADEAQQASDLPTDPTPAPSPDPLATASPSPSPTPGMQTFTVANNACNNSKCAGGSNGVKASDPNNAKTALKLCNDLGFPKLVDWTIGGQPGGMFCSFNGGVFGCDSSCSSCNIITGVTCLR